MNPTIQHINHTTQPEQLPLALVDLNCMKCSQLQDKEPLITTLTFMEDGYIYLYT